jgi:hypothetical protein
MNTATFSRLAAAAASVATTFVMFTGVVSLSGHPKADSGVQLAVAAAAVTPATPATPR